MNRTQSQVKDFHTAFDLKIENTPTIPNKATIQLRIDLIREELWELVTAFEDEDIVEVADALGDLTYVVMGTAVSCGIDMEPVMEAIHESNMSKVGGKKAPNGKLIKPDTYKPVDLVPILEAQR